MKDEAFLVSRYLTRHQALTIPMNGWGRQLCLYTSNTNGPYHHLRFLRRTVGFIHRFPLYGWVGRTRSLLPHSCLLLDVSPSSSIFHFYIRQTEKELDKTTIN